MKEALSYDETLLASVRSKMTVPKWYEAKDAYDQKKYKEALLHLFDYVDMDIRNKYGNEDGTFFKIPHGSVIVEIEITEDEFKVKAPFLKVGEGSKIPLYRRIAEVNFAPLNLAQIKLKEDNLNFFYSCPLRLCEPYKIYYVLQEICHNADNFDDEFIELFNVTPSIEPHIEQYDQATLDKAWTKFRECLEEADTYMEYLDQKRMSNFNWDIINITLKRMEYIMPASGKLRTDIERAVKDLYSRDHIQDRIQRGKVFLETLKKKSKEEYTSDIYIAESFISIKARSDINSVKQSWERPHEQALKEIQNSDHLGATLTILLAFYDLYYYNNVPDDINDKVVFALKKASKQNWEAAATHLMEGMNAVLNETTIQTKTPKKGFFSKLFG